MFQNLPTNIWSSSWVITLPLTASPFCSVKLFRKIPSSINWTTSEGPGFWKRPFSFTSAPKTHENFASPWRSKARCVRRWRFDMTLGSRENWGFRGEGSIGKQGNLGDVKWIYHGLHPHSGKVSEAIFFFFGSVWLTSFFDGLALKLSKKRSAPIG